MTALSAMLANDKQVRGFVFVMLTSSVAAALRQTVTLSTLFVHLGSSSIAARPIGSRIDQFPHSPVCGGTRVKAIAPLCTSAAQIGLMMGTCANGSDGKAIKNAVMGH
jgi:hypothetical protein